MQFKAAVPCPIPTGPGESFSPFSSQGPVGKAWPGLGCSGTLGTTVVEAAGDRGGLVVSPQHSAPRGNDGDVDGAVREQDEAQGPSRAALGMGQGGRGDTVMAERPRAPQGHRELGPRSPISAGTPCPSRVPQHPSSPHRLPGGRSLQRCPRPRDVAAGGRGQETQAESQGTW